MFLRSIATAHAFRKFIVAAAIGPALLLLGHGHAAAQELPGISLLSPGDAVVTGFSGILPPPPPPAPPPPGDPLDETFINLDGPSMQIERLQPSGPPSGQLIPSPPVFTARARDVGQVFAITLDDAVAPNIYLGATSAFGLQIVTPDADGDGLPERVKTGQPGATFMEGQWGPGGSPGSIWKVDGTTGAISLFTTIGANAGPGLGDVVYDRTSHQFFVSDLDTGLIYRLDSTGLLTDTFDHGLNGRPHKGLAPVADDNSEMDVTSAAFNSEDPATWGYTQRERMVWGLAMHGGRLYYAVADGPQIWSVGIRLDGTFADDARWELDVTGLASNDPISDIAFDNQGRMILAQRGAQRGSYDYTIFAEPKTSSVVRYQREIPDDPTTPSTWVEVADQYAIGFRPDGHNASGGVALGYGYDANGYVIPNSCGQYLWSTGEALRDNPALAAQLSAGGPATVDGLQGNDRDLVRPQNDPPFSSYFTDYDGDFDHPEHAGWIGDVEIYQSCQGAGGYGWYVPPYFPPPGWTPPPTGTFNLSLDKEADPKQCFAGGSGWLCYYTIRVTNTGASPYWGPISVHDWLPGLPPGASVTFDFQPPWTCGAVGPSDYQCDYPPVLLYPGESVDLYVTVDLPASDDLCYVDNAAQLLWTPGYGDANPWDDIDYATAIIPDSKCAPHGDKSNLKIEKKAVHDICPTDGTSWFCIFDITITNTGPGVYNGPIQVTDTLSVPDPIGYAPKPNPPDWTCVPPAGGAYTCDHAPVVLNPGQNVHLYIGVLVPVADQEKNGKCTVENEARITQAPGGTPLNTNPGDDHASAEAKTPGKNCEPVHGEKTDLSIRKEGQQCFAMNYNGQPGYGCLFKVTVKNEGPADFVGPTLTVHDTYGPTPTTPLFGAPGWACAPAGGNSFDCNYSGPYPLSAGSSTFYWTGVFVPRGSDVCRITNQAKITAPPGGNDQNTNPANDDSGVVVDMVPSPDCQPPPERHSNIKIEKVGGHCVPTPVGAAPAVTCNFGIKVTNTGPDSFNGVVGFLDAAAYGVAHITPVVAPGWVCAQNASLSACVLNGLFANGATATFGLQVTAPLALVQQNNCSLRNIAAIKAPPVGQWNTIAADDVSAIITDTVPANLCHPLVPATNLAIEKVSHGDCGPGENVRGFKCDFTVTVTNTGGTLAAGPIAVQEQIPPGVGFGYNGAGVTCSGGGTTWSCSYQNNLAPGASFSFDVSLFVSPSYGAAGAAAVPDACHVTNLAMISSPLGPPSNQQPGDDSAQATAFVPSPQCVSPAQTCPLAQKMPGGGCCPDGQVWNGRVCSGELPPPPPPPPPGVCPKGFVGTPPDCRPIILQCPQGSVGIPPNCRCPTGTIGTPPNCRPIVQVCPPGTVGKFPNCRCPPGMHGIPPRCIVDKCPAGTIGTPPDCKPIVRLCPPDSVGTPPNCRCKPGTQGDPGHCVPIVKKCPTGMIGTPPNCKPIVLQCPSDSVGRPPNCRCKPGTQGNPGHCVPIVKKCPTGFIGTPPNCKPITIVVPKCPADSTGRPPNCRCKQGTIGKPGQCKPLVLKPAGPVITLPKTCPKGFQGQPPNCIEIPR